MPKFTVIDKSGMSYSIDADYVLSATSECNNISFVNRSDNYFGNTVVAQFQLSSITGFFNNDSGNIKESTNEN